MVEEAAGTRMFEERKDKAKKTMGKKDKRVQEIKDILGEERRKRSPPSSSSTNSVPKALLHSILKIRERA
jgi:chromosome segregation ATPase